MEPIFTREEAIEWLKKNRMIGHGENNFWNIYEDWDGEMDFVPPQAKGRYSKWIKATQRAQLREAQKEFREAEERLDRAWHKVLRLDWEGNTKEEIQDEIDMLEKSEDEDDRKKASILQEILDATRRGRQ